MKPIITIFAISIGGAIGANLRYYAGIWLSNISNFPYATLAVNTIGSLIAGILLVIIIEKSLLSETYRLLLLVGLCGSLTTFSSFSLETLALFNTSQYPQAVLNIFLNIALSLLAAGTGIILMRYLLRLFPL